MSPEAVSPSGAVSDRNMAEAALRLDAAARERLETRAEVLKAMGHPTRLFIVEELARGPRCVSELTDLIGDDMSTVSRHLGVLAGVGIVCGERRASQVLYHLRIPCILNVFACVEQALTAESACCPKETRCDSDRRPSMRRIQVLGVGCPKCRNLAENAEAAAKELGIEYELVKVTAIEEIMAFKVMATPALVVDGTVKAAGKVPSTEEIKAMLR